MSSIGAQQCHQVPAWVPRGTGGADLCDLADDDPLTEPGMVRS
ncbi:MAG: hypothetical protein ACLTT1_18035 [[Clostridium] scindens]